MTVEEFSDLFDVLVDSYKRFKAFDSLLSLDSLEFSEYEKSVYLTLAQEDYVKEFYSSKYSIYSFENTEECRRVLDTLVCLDQPVRREQNILGNYYYTEFLILKDCWFIIYDFCTLNSQNTQCQNNTFILVIPVLHNELHRVLNNPFRGPSSRKVLRVDIGKDRIQLISTDRIENYAIRYIKKPDPIILTDLSIDDLKIDGESSPKTCQLDSSVHRDILDRAVNLAISHRVPNNNNSKKSAEE